MKKLLQFGLLVVVLAFPSLMPWPQFLPIHHTWTLTQVKDNPTCPTNAACPVTVTSTGAGHLLVAGLMDGSTGQTISAVTAAACTGSWTHALNSASSGTGDGSGDLYYCLNSASGQTSISITGSPGNCADGSCIGVIWEASSNVGGIAVDSGATPSNNVSDVACTSCAGVALSLSSNNKFIAVLAPAGDTCTGLTGTGFSIDFSNVSGDCIGHGINIATSGTVTSPATWTQSSSATLVGSAAAFQESGGAGAGIGAGAGGKSGLGGNSGIGD